MNERLKRIRKELDLSQEEFGKRLGITGGGISKLEKGRKKSHRANVKVHLPRI